MMDNFLSKIETIASEYNNSFNRKEFREIIEKKMGFKLSDKMVQRYIKKGILPESLKGGCFSIEHLYVAVTIGIMREESERKFPKILEDKNLCLPENARQFLKTYNTIPKSDKSNKNNKDNKKNKINKNSNKEVSQLIKKLKEVINYLQKL